MFAAFQYMNGEMNNPKDILDGDAVTDKIRNFLKDHSQSIEVDLYNEENIRSSYQTFLEEVNPKSNQFYEAIKIELTAFCDDHNLSPSLKAAARYYLALINYKGLEGDKSYKAARVGFTVSLENSDLLPFEKSEALFYLAEMNYKGLGGNVNYESARTKFTVSCDNPNLLASQRAAVRFYLAEMNSYGYGVDKVSPDEAEKEIFACCEDPDLSEKLKSEAMFRIAEIQLGYSYFDEATGLKVDYSDHKMAKRILESSSGDINLSADKRAIARFYLGELAYLQDDYPDARKKLLTSLNDLDLTPYQRDKARFYLAVMDYLGLGGQINYESAKAGFTASCNDSDLLIFELTEAQFYLAKMNYLGLGGRPDLSAAKEGFKFVIDSADIDPSLKKEAQNFLSEISSATSSE